MSSCVIIESDHEFDCDSVSVTESDCVCDCDSYND